MRRFWTIVSLLAWTGICSAQISSSTLNGTVTDSSGSVIPRAKVSALSKSTGFARSVTSNESGGYVISELPPGTYEVSAEAPGFKRTVVSDIRLFVGQTATTDIQMEVGQLTESVSVTSEAQLLQESSSQVG